MARMDAPGHNSGEVDLRGRMATLLETEEGGHKAI